MITVAGVCSGVGGFDIAFGRAGAQVLWSCENDPNCRLLLARRFPDVHCYSDMLGDEILGAQAPDVFVGGTPCQGFSVAGLRKGLSDDRSNLALRFLQLADHFGPTVILWENVPGVLSDKENAFGCFLAGLVGADAPLLPTRECGGRWTNAGLVAGPKRTAAWRVLDSQYFGVAQRRERVFVVASPRAELPFQILFEPEGVRRHSAPRREAGQRTAPTLEGRAGRSGCNSFATSGGLAAYGGNNTEGPIDVATACNAHGGPTGRMDFESETFVAHALRADGFDASEDGTGRGTPLVPIIVPPLNAGGNETGGNRQPGTSVDTCESLIPVAIAFTERTRPDGRSFECQEELAYALLNPGSGGRTHSRQIAQGYAVRRLTPRECERLQGFLDEWTAVLNAKGKPMADGPRYKQMGNAVTVPVVEWLARRILSTL